MSTLEARQDALERRRRRDKGRRDALRWAAHKDKVRKRIAARDGVAEYVWGDLVGAADPTGISSSHLCRFERYTIFTGGCHGRGTIFQGETIDNAVLKFVRGVWLNPDGSPKYLHGDGSPMRSVHCIAFADAGFSILADAKAHLAELHKD